MEEGTGRNDEVVVGREFSALIIHISGAEEADVHKGNKEQSEDQDKRSSPVHSSSSLILYAFLCLLLYSRKVSAQLVATDEFGIFYGILFLFVV